MQFLMILIKISQSIAQCNQFLIKIFRFFFDRIFSLKLNYPYCFQSSYPKAYPIAAKVITEIVTELKNSDMSLLSRNSPELTYYNWENYLRCSMIRMLKVSELLEKVGSHLKILDFGSYFGNFSLFCSQLGHTVEAVDSYKNYGHALDFIFEKCKRYNIPIYEMTEVGYDLSGLKKNSYDVVLCLGVIEHIPHTPRFMMQALSSVLKEGGHLILETPNLAYIYNRQKLLAGHTIYPPLKSQYYTQIPFEGHHREYTIEELRWILKKNQFQEVSLQTYIYSLYQLPHINGIDLLNYMKMKSDPTLRELIITLAKKTALRNGNKLLPPQGQVKQIPGLS